MNKSVIREMFFGKRGTYEHISLSEQFREAEKTMFDAVDAFLALLSDEQKKSFDNAYETIISKNAEYATDHFIEGFKFGLLMGIEARMTA